MPISNPKEEIDSRILRLIGLEDVFDLDYETYLTLLKESMVKSRMTKKTIPTEEIMLLTDEYKRVKSKKDKGRFEVKQKKISASYFGGGDIKGKLIGTNPVKGLLPAQAITKSPLTKSLEDSISAIAASIVSISETLKQQKKITDDTSSYNKRQAEREKRGLAESNLEKRFEGLKKTAEKIIAPVKSLLDKIIQFFTTVILGRIVYKLVEWLGDEKNASKVKSIIRFVKNWWPALLGSYILFGTSFGGLIRGLTGMVGRFIFQIGRVAIPQLLGLIRANPLVAAGAITGLAAGGAEMWRQKEEKNQISKEAKKRNVSPEVVKQEKVKSDSGFLGLLGQGFGKMGPLGYAGGGIASGYVSGEKGVDKVPAMLSDGEFVMSRGAVEKYGVDTLEAMNAAGGGTNKPKMIGGKTYAAGGGMIGRSNTPFFKDPINAISRFIKFKFGADPSKQSTWGFPTISSSSQSTPKFSSSQGVSTGSLMTDPIGAVSRIVNNLGIKTPNVTTSKKSDSSQNIISKALGSIQQKFGGGSKSIKSGEKNIFQEIIEKLQGPGAATYRNAGNIYAKQMLGGFGGPISERDLAPESQKELQKAIQRAKKRTGSEIAKAEAKIKELRAQGAKDGNPALETQKSFLKKLKSGGIRVQYADYADEKGKMSENAKNAKNILGQFWAYGRDKKQGGGYRIEDKYDFDKMKDPMSVLFGKGKSTQQRLQALHQLNPFKGKGDVDMVLGGKRTASESWGLSTSKTLLGGMFGASGKPKDINQQAKIAKLKPRTGAVKPPSKSSIKVVRTKANTIGRGSGGGRQSSSRPPSFSASTRGSGSKANTLGLPNQASYR